MSCSLPQRRTGFSLMELLVVIAILAVLLALIVPAFHTIGRAAHLTTATGLVLDELNLARQAALTRDRPVEVRFYLLRSELDPNDKAYRAIRTYLSSEDGNQMSALGPMKTLPVSVVASKDDQFSTLLSETIRPAQANEVEDVPNAPATPYKPIRFRPTGGVELTSYTSNNDTWFLTLKDETDKGDTQRPANNFATIQIDPVTGRTRQFRP